jgi:hypothetical protein
MMKRFTLRFAAILVVLSWAHVSAAQTADEIIEKSITAFGGRAALEKIKTRVAIGDVMLSTQAGEIPGTIELTNAAPNKTRALLKADLSAFGAGQLEIDQRFDGTTGYILDSMQGDRPITGNQLENMRNSSFPHPFLTYKANGVKITMIGKEKVGDRDAFVLNIEPPSGSAMKQYIDAETYLPIKAVSKVNVAPVGEFEQTTETSDYRDVDGVKVPFKVKNTSSVQGMTMTFVKITHNAPVDEKIFSKP